MPTDDERTRRRLGDATRSRIADLAAGWDVPADEPPPKAAIPELTPDPDPPAVVAPPPPPPPSPPPRARSKTQPPPPPGSAERKQLEDAILETPASPPVASTAPTPGPPPPPPKPFAKSGPTHTGTVSLVGAINHTPPPAVIASTKPVRDAADLSDPPLPQTSGTSSKAPDPKAIADLFGSQPVEEQPATVKFERGDPTSLGEDPTVASFSVGTGTLRPQAMLRRKRGIGGDMKYVVTVLFGVRKARIELEGLEAKQELRQQSRRRHLVTLGRSAVTMDGFDHPALGPARDVLAGVEDERSRHAGAVAEADSELMRVRRDREAKATEHRETLAALDKELIDIEKKLEPMQKEVAGVARRADELTSSLRKLDHKIANTEMSQQGVAPASRAAIQAELATLKADRTAVQRDEPKLAAELDALNPRVAALESKRAEAKRKKQEIEKAEVDDQRRSDELLAAIGAKRKVVDRASSDAETLRDKVLLELGERLYNDRPRALGPELSPIDVIDVELGTSDRRVMELKEILSSVDNNKLARGIAVYVLVLAVIVAVVLFALGVF